MLVGTPLFAGCSQVPSLEAAVGDENPQILVRDVVQRIKCEIADAFDDKIDAPGYEWLQNWTAKVDLTLQVSESGGTSPSVSYTKILPNAFNYAAGSGSLTSTVIGAVGQSFTLTAGGNYSEQAQRSETLTFTVSLTEIKTWRLGKDRFLRRRGFIEAADHYCDPGDREFRGKLGLKQWIDTALYPVHTTHQLQAGIHPQAKNAPPAAKSPEPKTTTKEFVGIPYETAKKDITAAADNAAKAAKKADDAMTAVGTSISNVQTTMQNAINPYFSVLPDYIKHNIAADQNALGTIRTQVASDAARADKANDEAQSILDGFNKLDPKKDVSKSLVDEIKTAADTAQLFGDDAVKQQTAAKKIEDDLTNYKPNPPIDAIGHSVQFIVNYGGSVTPNWSLLVWKGPGLTIPGASISGVRTNIMNIALGPTSEQTRLLLNQTLTNTLTH